MAQKISQMTEQTTASMTETGTSDFLGGYTMTGGNANRKFSLSGLANYFLNKFKMTLGGSSQTVKSAIDTLNSKVSQLTGDGRHEISVLDASDYMRLYFNIKNDSDTWMALDVSDNGMVKLIGKKDGVWRTVVTLHEADS